MFSKIETFEETTFLLVISSSYSSLNFMIFESIEIRSNGTSTTILNHNKSTYLVSQSNLSFVL